MSYIGEFIKERRIVPATIPIPKEVPIEQPSQPVSVPEEAPVFEPART